MWKDYSIGFIKKNRASSVSVLVAAFISALYLSTQKKNGRYTVRVQYSTEVRNDISIS